MPTTRENVLINIKSIYHEPSDQLISADQVNLKFVSTCLQNLKEIAESKRNSFEDKKLIEKFKLKLLKTVSVIINDYASGISECVSPIPDREIITSSPPFGHYYFYMLSGLVVNLLHGFLSSYALLSLIPHIAGLALTLPHAAMTLLNGFAYYLYEGYVLKKNLNIPIMDGSTLEYLELFEKQVSLMKVINDKLSHFNFVSEMKPDDYGVLSAVAAQLNESVNINKKLFCDYKESRKSFIFRQSIIIFGGIMSAGGAYFAFNSFITKFAIGLVATPLVGVLGAVFVGLAVGFYIGQRRHKVYKMMNPQAFKFKEIQDKFNDFKVRDKGYFDALIKRKSKLVAIQAPIVSGKDDSPVVARNGLNSSVSSHSARLFFNSKLRPKQIKCSREIQQNGSRPNF